LSETKARSSRTTYRAAHQAARDRIMLSDLGSKRPDALRSDAPGSSIPVWKVDPQHPEPQIISLAGKMLSQGSVIVYPTETYYGLGGSAKSPLAVERIFRIKGRKFSKPLPLIASNLAAVHQAVAEWPIIAERLARAFWPGPLTLILSAASSILPLIHANTGRLAIRISSHPVATALATEVGGLLIATSANPSDRPAYQTPWGMPGEFVAQVDGVIDAGSCGGNEANLPSTIVDVTSIVPRLIRTGRIPWEGLVQAVGLSENTGDRRQKTE